MSVRQKPSEWTTYKINVGFVKEATRDYKWSAILGYGFHFTDYHLSPSAKKETQVKQERKMSSN